MKIYNYCFLFSITHECDIFKCSRIFLTIFVSSNSPKFKSNLQAGHLCSHNTHLVQRIFLHYLHSWMSMAGIFPQQKQDNILSVSIVILSSISTLKSRNNLALYYLKIVDVSSITRLIELIFFDIASRIGPPLRIHCRLRTLSRRIWIFKCLSSSFEPGHDVLIDFIIISYFVSN